MRKVIFPLLLMASVCMIAKPTYDFRLDGIYYRIDKKQVCVAKGDELYEGDVVIPAHVEGVEGPRPEPTLTSACRPRELPSFSSDSQPLCDVRSDHRQTS